MGLFRRAKTVCPSCGVERRADVGEKHSKLKVWQIVCCGCEAHLKAPIGAEWWMAYTDPDGRYKRRKIGTNRRAAQRALEAVRTDIASGRYIDKKATCRHTLGELLDRHLERIRPARTAENYRSDTSTTRRLRRGLGAEIRLDRIGKAQLDAYRADREKAGIACATINRELSVLSSALTWAVERGWLAVRPKIVLPNPRNERTRFLSKHEAARLVMACPDRIRGVVRALLATGMRLGETLKMEWSWVDLEKLLISIPAGATKSKRARHVPINGDLREVLEAARDRAEPGNPRVFAHVTGTKAVWYAFVKAVKAVGLGDLHAHDLRHTAASWMVQGGEDLYRVACILGHRSLAMTQRYAHFAPGHLKSAVEHTRLDLGEGPEDTAGEVEANSTPQTLTGKIVPFPSAVNSRG